MSATLFASGLYPAYQSNNPPFQPIPIHSKPQTLDNTILTGDKPCPKFIQLRSQILNTTYFRKFDHDNKELYDFMSEKMGKRINTFLGLEVDYDTFFIENMFNFTLPDWVKEIYPTKLKQILYFNVVLPTYTTEMARYKVGCLYSEILNYLKSFTSEHNEFVSDFNRKESGRKMLAISGHDVNIAALLNTLKVPQITHPPYSSSIIFELKKRNNSEFYVNVLYKNNTEIQRLKVPGCEFDCGMNNFIEYLRPIVMSPKEWDKNCMV